MPGRHARSWGIFMIELKNIRKVFRSPDGQSLEALKGVSLRIGEGEIFGIIGLSGAGKSTLLRMLNRLEEPTEGDVFIRGVSMVSLDAKGLRRARRRMGMIFQHFNLLRSRTVSGNVAYPLEIDGWAREDIRERVAEMLELVGLADKADSYPSQLSGGQKQRVAIARALANRPELLLSDEATSALDPKTTKSILQLLGEINRKLGLTIVLITHEMDVIREICHRVAIMEGGEVVETGTVQEVFMNPRSRTSQEFLSHLPRTTYDGESLPRIAGCPLAILHFNGGTAERPVISEAIRHSGADVNILAGDIDRLHSSRVGSLVVQFSGEPERVKAALESIRGDQVSVDVIWNG